MRLVCVVAAALLLSVAGWSSEITITSDPPLPVPNLVVNPGAELGQGDKPADWSFSTATPSNFETRWADNGRSGKCLWAKAKTGVMSGYWSQPVPVQPGKSYLFKGFYRIGGGRMLIYAHGSVPKADGRRAAVDERFLRGTMRGHWLVPVFLPPDSLGGPDPETWFPFRLKAKIPDPMQAITLSLGLYFEAGEVSFDDMWAGMAETDVKVSVQAALGETLQKVVITRAGSDKPIFTSPALKAGTTHFETLLQAQATDEVYMVTATLGDGKTIQRRYPEGEVR